MGKNANLHQLSERVTVVYYIGDTGACRVDIGPNTAREKAAELLLKMGLRECTREEWQAKRREQQRMERKERGDEREEHSQL